MTQSAKKITPAITVSVDVGKLMLRVLREFRVELKGVQPTARYYVTRSKRAYRRASIHPGPGEPLILKDDAEGALQRAIARVALAEGARPNCACNPTTAEVRT